VTNEKLKEILESPGHPHHIVEEAFMKLYIRAPNRNEAQGIIDLAKRNYPDVLRSASTVVNIPRDLTAADDSP